MYRQTAPEALGDVELIDRILGGEAGLFEELLNRYKNRVVRIVSRHIPREDVEEVAHTVFIKVFQSLATYQQKSRLENWLSAVAVRTCYDFWRKRYRSREIAVSELSEAHRNWLEHVAAEESDRSFTRAAHGKEAEELIRWALGHLSAKDRMVLELIYLQDHSILEAAELLGWTQTTVKVRAFRARRKLQKLLNHATACDSEGI